MSTNAETTPAGYVKDARGRLVPESMIKPVDQLRDQTILSLVKDAKELQQRMTDYKARAHADIAAFVEASHEQYGVKVGGSKGNVSLVTFDGRYKIHRQIAEHLQFGEELQAAKELIDTRAMEAISDSIRVTGTKPYIRLYERVGDTEEYVAISLDFAAI